MAINYIRGIDVSEHQGEINFAKVKKNDISFVIPRSSLGFSTVDKFFLQNVVQAKKNGIAVPAIYHFSYALTKEDADKEACFVAELAEKAGLPAKTIIFYDLEYDNVDRYAKQTTNHLGKAVNITKTKASDMAAAFCERIKAAGFVPGIYSNTDYLDRMFTKSVISRYILWHADYRKSATPDSRATFFQYTSEAKIDGINGNVDMNEYLGQEKLEVPADETPKKSDEDVAKEVIAGKWGNGTDRKKKLEAAGYNYNAIQKIVNALVAKNQKSVDVLAQEVIEGKWGNGDERKKKLSEAGYDYKAVQDKVNELMKNSANKPIITNGKKVSPAQSRNDALAGTYTVRVANLNMRYIPNKLTADNVVKVLKMGEKVQNFGFYTQFGGSKWLLIQHGNDTGWICASYVSK